MKKKEFLKAYESISKLEDLLTEAKKQFNEIPSDIQQAVLDYHNEPATIQYCLRWGLQATKELRQDWHNLVSGMSCGDN